MSQQSSSKNQLIPIHVVNRKGFIYSVESMKRLREEYNISGTLVGVLPQFPQQNVFHGMPLQLMPEEVKYLVEELKVAYLVDDSRAHDLALWAFDPETDGINVEKYRSEIQRTQADAHKQMALMKRRKALKLDPNAPLSPEEIKILEKMDGSSAVFYEIPTSTLEVKEYLPAYSLYEQTFKDRQLNNNNKNNTNTNMRQDDMNIINDGDNYETASTNSLVKVETPKDASYEIYKHLQQKGYFLSPGLRFGGQFLAYPGDSLRYHSHFTVTGYDFNEKFKIHDLVGGGRLGTTVKKSWFVGAKSNNKKEEDQYYGFSVEWSRFG